MYNRGVNKYNREILPNGLRVITVPLANVESVTVMVAVKAGSRYESRQEMGLSHFLEHMAFKGTKKRPSALAISTEIDSVGGEFNASTGKESTVYYIKTAAKHVELSLDMLSDMLNNSLLKTEEIEREKGVICEEINMYNDTPMAKVGLVYEKLLYGDTPMGWSIAGEKDIVQKFDRINFIDYIKRLYSANNMCVVVSGNPEAVGNTQKIINSKFKIQITNQIQNSKFKTVTESQKKPAIEIFYKDTDQAHLCLGVRTFSRHDRRRYALDVLATILGGGMSSRLFIEVRERRGLAYYVRTGTDEYDDVGNLTTQAGVKVEKLEEAVETIWKEYQKLKRPGLSCTKGQAFQGCELRKAKDFLKGHFVLGMENSREVAGFYAGSELLEKEIKTPDEEMGSIEAVTISDVLSVAQEIFQPKNLNLAVVGPFKSSLNTRIEQIFTK